MVHLKDSRNAEWPAILKCISEKQYLAGIEVHNDKNQRVNVADQFKYMFSYPKALPQDLPGFYNYLPNYPGSKPAHADSRFYWDKVKFGGIY